MNAKTRFLSGNIVALALVLTAIILLAGLGIGVVVMEGSKSAQENDNAVAAYYMANSGIEQQIYSVRKDDLSLSLVATASSSYPGNNKWISTTGYEQVGQKLISYLKAEDFAFADLFDPDNLSNIFSTSFLPSSIIFGSS